VTLFMSSNKNPKAFHRERKGTDAEGRQWVAPPTTGRNGRPGDDDKQVARHRALSETQRALPDAHPVEGQRAERDKGSEGVYEWRNQCPKDNTSVRGAEGPEAWRTSLGEDCRRETAFKDPVKPQSGLAGLGRGGVGDGHQSPQPRESKEGSFGKNKTEKGERGGGRCSERVLAYATGGVSDTWASDHQKRATGRKSILSQSDCSNGHFPTGLSTSERKNRKGNTNDAPRG